MTKNNNEDNSSNINENKKYLVLLYINNMSERLGSMVNSSQIIILINWIK